MSGAIAFTVGHSTHSGPELVGLLASHDIELVADVRRAPASRRVPAANGPALAATLAAAGIGYRHLGRLGGWRRARPDSPNAGWRNASFRGYADFMLTPEFAAALAELEALARARRTAILCAESLWWRCHRRLVADALVTRGWRVCHIGPDGRLAPHRLTDVARVEDGLLTYPPPNEAPGADPPPP